MIEGKTKFDAGFFLDLVLLGAIFFDRLAGRARRELRRRSVLVGGAQEQDVKPLRPLEPREDVRRQHRADEIAEMLDAVDVGQRGRDQNAGHGRGG